MTVLSDHPLQNELRAAADKVFYATKVGKNISAIGELQRQLAAAQPDEEADRVKKEILDRAVSIATSEIDPEIQKYYAELALTLEPDNLDAQCTLVEFFAESDPQKALSIADRMQFKPAGLRPFLNTRLTAMTLARTLNPEATGVEHMLNGMGIRHEFASNWPDIKGYLRSTAPLDSVAPILDKLNACIEAEPDQVAHKLVKGWYVALVEQDIVRQLAEASRQDLCHKADYYKNIRNLLPKVQGGLEILEGAIDKDCDGFALQLACIVAGFKGEHEKQAGLLEHEIALYGEDERILRSLSLAWGKAAESASEQGNNEAATEFANRRLGVDEWIIRLETAKPA